MDREMLKKIVRLVVPAIIEYSLQVLTNYADYIMVGSLGVTASAAIGITTEITYLLKGAVNALGIGVLAYISAAIGARKTDKIKTASVQAVYTSVAVGIVLTVISLAISPFVPCWMGAEEDIAGLASGYFAIANAPFIFISLNMVLGYALKASGDMKTPLFINGAVNILNIIFNYLLIYPTRDIVVFGRTVRMVGAGLGVYGAALGTAVSTAIGGVLMLVGFMRNGSISPKGEKRLLDRDIIREFVRVGIPSMLTRLTNNTGRVVFTGIVAHLGTVMYSAHTISFTAESAFNIPSIGMMSAVAAMAGTVKGEGDIKKLNRLTKTLCILGAGVMAVMSCLMFALSDRMFTLFTSDSEVLEICPKLLRIVAFNEPILIIAFIIESVFNGIGKTKLPFIAGTISQWTFRVGGAWVCLNIFGLTVEAAWYCLITDNFVRCIILSAEYIALNKKLI
ncbi:MAG: MATE family efflux transporter [Ruminococcus sp.]|nr:MATE family efflux transporter [Ruminococcus sp.]